MIMRNIRQTFLEEDSLLVYAERAPVHSYVSTLLLNLSQNIRILEKEVLLQMKKDQSVNQIKKKKKTGRPNAPPLQL
jgi:hypothetical protein